MAHLRSQSIYYVCGASSIYVPSSQARYVDEKVCKPWPDIRGQVRMMTPGEGARVELMREWPLLKRVGWSGKSISLLDWRSPLYYTGPWVGDAMHIDLDGAYNQIYRRLWLDTSFPRGYYGRYALRDVAQRLKPWKAARNSIVGLSRSREGVAYRGQKRIKLKMKNRYLSPGLWATVQAILHMVMGQAIKFGAIYGNVDGYIIPLTDWSFVEEFTEWLSDLGFRWSIRSHGEAEVVSWNNYIVGGNATKAYKLNLKHKSRSFSNVDTRDFQRWGTYWQNCGRIAEAKGDGPPPR
jgi:hypothetical protein